MKLTTLPALLLLSACAAPPPPAVEIHDIRDLSQALDPVNGDERIRDLVCRNVPAAGITVKNGALIVEDGHDAQARVRDFLAKLRRHDGLLLKLDVSIFDTEVFDQVGAGILRPLASRWSSMPARWVDPVLAVARQERRHLRTLRPATVFNSQSLEIEVPVDGAAPRDVVKMRLRPIASADRKTLTLELSALGERVASVSLPGGDVLVGDLPDHRSILVRPTLVPLASR